MNIGFKTTSGDFSLRSAALVIRDNKLLIAKSDEFDCFYTVGGGIMENESSEEAVVRELFEEIGCCFEVERLCFVQERFFPVGDTCHHEVVFFYLMKDADVELSNGRNTDQPNERLYWVPIEDLEKIKLVPAFFKDGGKRASGQNHSHCLS